MSHPKIKGIEWMDSEIPEIIAVPITLEDRMYKDLGLDKVEPNTMQITQYVDLSKMAGLRRWYITEEGSTTECVVDVVGMSDFIADVPIENMLEAWVYYKRWKESKK